MEHSDPGSYRGGERSRRGRRRRVTAGLIAGPSVVGAALLGAVALAAPALAAAPGTPTGADGPVQTSFPDAFTYSLQNPEANPPGANADCAPSAAHPRPVILVHGTWEDAYDNWSGVTRQLSDAGYCVYALNFGKSGLLEQGGLGALLPGVDGTAPVQDSAKELAAFTDAVLAETGASQVDMVGHSQGGIVIRQYLKAEGGADNALNVVTLGATNNGTGLLGIGTLGRAFNNAGIPVLQLVQLGVGVSGIQQVFDSPFLEQLNAGGETMAGVNYTVVATEYDEVSNPYEWTFLTDNPAGAFVQNITLQDGCAQDISDHVSMSYSPRVLDIVETAIANNDPRATAMNLDELACEPNGFIAGDTGSLSSMGSATAGSSGSLRAGVGSSAGSSEAVRNGTGSASGSFGPNSGSADGSAKTMSATGSSDTGSDG